MTHGRMNSFVLFGLNLSCERWTSTFRETDMEVFTLIKVFSSDPATICNTLIELDWHFAPLKWGIWFVWLCTIQLIPNLLILCIFKLLRNWKYGGHYSTSNVCIPTLRLRPTPHIHLHHIILPIFIHGKTNWGVALCLLVPNSRCCI